MAKSNNLSTLLNQLSRGGSRVQSGSINNLVAQATDSAGSGRALGTGRNSEIRTSSFSGPTEARGIVFGKPASSSRATQQTGGELTKLLKQTATDGIMSALGGSFGLGSITGIGSIVSGIVSLFGSGKKSPPPLVEFQLPASESRTLYVGGNNGTLYSGSASHSVNTAPAGAGIYSTAEAHQSSSNPQWIQDQNSQIAQAVKTALLHSSSLADVISEI